MPPYHLVHLVIPMHGAASQAELQEMKLGGNVGPPTRSMHCCMQLLASNAPSAYAHEDASGHGTYIHATFLGQESTSCCLGQRYRCVLAASPLQHHKQYRQGHEESTRKITPCVHPLSKSPMNPDDEVARRWRGC